MVAKDFFKWQGRGDTVPTMFTLGEGGFISSSTGGGGAAGSFRLKCL